MANKYRNSKYRISVAGRDDLQNVPINIVDTSDGRDVLEDPLGNGGDKGSLRAETERVGKDDFTLKLTYK